MQSPWKKWLKRLLWIIPLILALFAGVWAFRLASSLGGGKGIGEVIKSWRDPRSLFPGQDRVVILIVGKDYNHDSKGMPYTKDARSDTIMLVAADLANQKLSALSVPRDTKIIDAEGHSRKINSSFQNGGVKGLEDALVQFGIHPDYFVELKDTAVEKIVNSVGGVDVEAIDDMYYDDSWARLHIDISKGRHHLSGEEAVGFVRFRKMGTHRVDENGRKIPIRRKSSLEEGDLRRTERQQQLIRALVASAMTPSNILHADSIVETGFSQINTDLSRPQVLALATMFKGSGSVGMTSASLPGTDLTEDHIYYWQPDMERAKLVVQWLLDGDVAAGKKVVRVAVYNASKFDGAARRAAEAITAEGFTSFSGGSTTEKVAEGKIYFRKASYQAFAQELATSLGIQTVAKDNSDPRADWLPEIRVILAGQSAEKFKAPAPKKPH